MLIICPDEPSLMWRFPFSDSYFGTSKTMLADLLPLVLHDLNEHGECTLPLDGANLLSIRLPPLLSSTTVYRSASGRRCSA